VARSPRRSWPLLNNLPQKLGALVAAVALWFAATGDRQAVVERTFDAPLLVRGRTADQSVSGLPSTVSVTLAGARDRLESLRGGMVEAYVNLAGVTVGNFEAPVTVVPPADTRVARMVPREVAGRMDVVESSLVPVRAAVTGLDGGTVVRVTVQPEEVTATGPRSVLEAIAAALAIVSPDAATATLTAVNEEGLPVQGVTLRPASVRITRSSLPALAQRTLPLVLAQPPAGLRYRTQTLSRTEVRVVGPPDVVSRMTSVTARPATTLQPGNVRVALRLDLPSGVTVLDENLSATLNVTTSG
jgi:YbbR domain-containing protein